MKLRRIPKRGEIWHGQLSCRNRVLVLEAEAGGSLCGQVIELDPMTMTLMEPNLIWLWKWNDYVDWHEEKTCLKS